MTLVTLFQKIKPFARPYHKLIIGALLLTLVGSLTAQVNAWVLLYAVDSISDMVRARQTLTQGLAILGFITIVLLSKELLNLFVQFGQKYFGEKLRIYLSHDLAQTVISRILTYRLAFYSPSANQPGKLQTRIDRGVESLSRLVQNFFIDIVPLFANAVVALIVMFNANVYVGLVGFCTMPVYYYVSRAQARKLTSARRRIKRLRENKSQGILSILESIPVIKSFIREDIEEEKQMHLQRILTDEQMRIRKTNFLFDGAKNFVEQIGVVAIILLTTYFVLTGSMTIGAIMFHILLFNNVSAPIRRLHLLYDQMNDALIYAEGFFDILESEREVEQSGSYRPDSLQGRFELRNVFFTYPGNESPTLHDISMSILPGKITALVGLSGAGKSTLINLLDTFHLPDSGEILLDGIALQSYDRSFVRANIGLVLQQNHIFNGSIEENIRYGKPEASAGEISQAARKAFLHDQVMTMKNGYQSSALSLSGGQKQKIAIARVFLKDPPIIFLDEPTASLDAVATEQIKNSMDAIKKDRTVVIISHSISQIIDAERIYVLEQGHMVESGSHERIYEQHGAYRRIFDAMARSLNVDKIARSYEKEAAPRL
ncbi:ABC transporter ATP-binding protein/permease [Desulfovibrio sp. OttesenSCG-928-A18]|nr:ABC transporter ATP-binding protein/permease [Desulfovibrio sp. OttesenSCG-928-A18]